MMERRRLLDVPAVSVHLHDKKTAVCPDCGKAFLRRSIWNHRKNKVCLKQANKVKARDLSHLNAEGQLLLVETNNSQRQTCPVEDCGRDYQGYSALQRHCRCDHKLKITSTSVSTSAGDSRLIDCGLCDSRLVGVAKLCEHVRLERDHWDKSGLLNDVDRPYELETRMFESERDYWRWKRRIEERSNETFVKYSLSRAADWTLHQFCCGRSRKSRSKNGKGSWQKIGFYCTAFIKARHFVSGEVEATFCLDHFGHDRRPAYRWTTQQFASDSPNTIDDQEQDVDVGPAQEQEQLAGEEEELAIHVDEEDEELLEEEQEAKVVDLEESLRIKDEFRDVLSDCLFLVEKIPMGRRDALMHLVQQATDFKTHVQAVCSLH